MKIFFLLLLLHGQTINAGHHRGIGSASAWAHVHSITIDHTKAGSSNSSNFPAYFGGTFTWLKSSGSGGQILNSTTCCANTETVPADLIFTSDSGCTTMLNWDIPSWTSTTGAIEAWVNIPTLSSSVDTVIYACTGNAAVTTYQATYTSTWNSNFSAVYHFGDSSTLDLHDSTTNANTCTNHSVTHTTPLLVTGGAANFVSASTQYLDCGAGSSLNLTTGFRLQGILSVPSLPGSGIFPFMLGKSAPFGSTSGYDYFLRDSGGTVAHSIFAEIFNGSSGFGSPAALGAHVPSTSTPYWWAGSYNSVTPVLGIANDGGSFTSDTPTNSLGSNASTHLFIGSADGTTAAFFWNGVLDEIRIMNVVVSTDWHLADFNSESSPSTFFSVVVIR